jgi:hypothetical protein
VARDLGIRHVQNRAGATGPADRARITPYGVRANAVALGIVRAGLAKHQLETRPAYAARAATASLLGELQTAEQIAEASRCWPHQQPQRWTERCCCSTPVARSAPCTEGLSLAASAPTVRTRCTTLPGPPRPSVVEPKFLCGWRRAGACIARPTREGYRVVCRPRRTPRGACLGGANRKETWAPRH